MFILKHIKCCGGKLKTKLDIKAPNNSGLGCMSWLRWNPYPIEIQRQYNLYQKPS